MNLRTRILYEDNDIFLIYKPAGIAVQSSATSIMDVESELRIYSMNKYKSSYIGIIHRLDQPVEGLLVIGRNKVATAFLNDQLRVGSLNKDYLAVVLGKPATKSAKYCDYIKKEKSLAILIGDNTDKSKLDKETKSAILEYEVIAEDDITTCLSIHIETGRFHQIRAQLAFHGLPLLGDQKYGSEDSIIYSKEKLIKNVALAANSISFLHPKTKKKMDFNIEPENSAFKKFIKEDKARE